MLQFISKKILKLWGWEIHNILPEGISKCVVIAVPHTSYYDFIVGRLTYWSMDLPVRFMIKKEIFWFPLGNIIKAMGGVPIDRGRDNRMIDYVSKLFEDHDQLFMVITPEGTRKKVKRWRKGFYYIALKANVPIALGYIDYGKKKGGIGKIFYPTGDFPKDFAEIEDFYRGIQAKHPERFNL